jgi:hypothetical protein
LPAIAVVLEPKKLVPVAVVPGSVLILVTVVSSGVRVEVTTWVTVVGSEIIVMRVTVCV